MKHVHITVVLLIFGTCIAGCDNERNAIKVTVVLPANGTAFRTVHQQFTAFTARKPRSASGRRIDLIEVYPSVDKFAALVAANPSFDIIICDSPEQLTTLAHVSAANVVNACGTRANCPAFIAPWVPPEKLEAVQQAFRAITEN